MERPLTCPHCTGPVPCVCPLHPTAELICMACAGQAGGRTSTAAKAAAARKNGRRGGRPRGRTELETMGADFRPPPPSPVTTPPRAGVPVRRVRVAEPRPAYIPPPDDPHRA